MESEKSPVTGRALRAAATLAVFALPVVIAIAGTLALTKPRTPDRGDGVPAGLRTV
ncbi:MAG TPA: hypothetical protein VMU08_13790 [Rhizomicrobium sp.]|nr:hypothetical protein [Rhizomicrobium sp.]